jgi:hypothetical protein
MRVGDTGALAGRVLDESCHYSGVRDVDRVTGSLRLHFVAVHAHCGPIFDDPIFTPVNQILMHRKLECRIYGFPFPPLRASNLLAILLNSWPEPSEIEFCVASYKQIK